MGGFAEALERARCRERERCIAIAERAVLSYAPTDPERLGAEDVLRRLRATSPLPPAG